MIRPSSESSIGPSLQEPQPLLCSYSVRRLPLLMVAIGSAVCVFLTSDWITLDPENDTVSAIIGMKEF